MSSADEKWIVVWWDEDGAMWSLTDDDGNIVARTFDEVRPMTEEQLESPDEHASRRRYAVPARLARESFGWDV